MCIYSYILHYVKIITEKSRLVDSAKLQLARIQHLCIIKKISRFNKGIMFVSNYQYTNLVNFCYNKNC